METRLESGQHDQTPRSWELVGLALCGGVLVASSTELLSGVGDGASTSLYALPLDDVWIHLSYARSLVESGTYGWNPGTWENGVTAPLWVFLLVVPLKLGVSAALAAKGLSLLSGLFALLFLWGLARDLEGPRVALAASVVFVLEPWTAVLAVSGMEVHAASAAALGAMFASCRGRWWLAGAAAAAAGLLRPELGLLVPVLLLCAPTSRARVAVLVPPTVAGGAWMLYGLFLSGHPLPNAFRTKVNAGYDLPGQLAAIGGFYSAAVRELGPFGLFLVLCAGGLVLLGFLCGTSRRRALLLVGLLPSGILAFYILALPLGASSDPLTAASIQSIYFARYLLVVQPFLILLGVLGAMRIDAKARSWARPGQFLSLLLGLALLWGTAKVERSALHEAYHANCAELEVLHGRMADWIRTNLPEDAVIGISDAGRIRYGVPQRLIDLTGLNSSELIGRSDRVPMILAQGMTHAAIWPAWHRGLQKDERLSWTRLGGTKVDRNTIAAHSMMLLFEVRPAQP